MESLGQKALRLTRYLAPSAVTFLLGTGALVFVDILLGRYASDADLKDWVLLKSVMLPLASLVLLGIDQVVVREPSKLKLFLSPVLTLATCIALTATGVVYATGFYTRPVILFFAILGVAGSYLFFGMFRAVLSFNAAQFARDGWKFLFLVALGPFYFLWGVSIEWILLGVLAITTSISIWRKSASTDRPMNEVHDEVNDFKSALHSSWPFCLAAFALSIASYGELLLLRGFGGTDLLPTYFRATILFVAPFVMFNTYIATFLSSFVRQSPNRFSALLLQYRWHVVALLPICPFLALAAGYAISPLLFPAQQTPFLWALFLSATAGMRLGYSVLSSYIGALGKRSEITAIAIYYVVTALLTPLVCYGLYLASGRLAESVAATGTIHWFARCIVGWRLTYRLCINNQRVQDSNPKSAAGN
jgi:hypothetical protein